MNFKKLKTELTEPQSAGGGKAAAAAGGAAAEATGAVTGRSSAQLSAGGALGSRTSVDQLASGKAATSFDWVAK